MQELLASTSSSPAWPATPRPGNLHFMLTPTFAEPAERERYEDFMARARGADRRQVRRLAQGRAWHGLNMAPFVEREWGAKATELMWRIKRLADPDGVLAPGSGPQPRSRGAPARTSRRRPRSRRSARPASSAGSASRSARAAT